MNTMVMHKAQFPKALGALAPAVPRPAAQRSAGQRPAVPLRPFFRRLSVAVAVATTLAVLVALIAVTPRAVDALAVPPVTATVELPRVVIRAERLPAGACPVPSEAGAACPVPLLSSSNE
jgi:hypothetical protein